jgi:hypothetical protein
VYLDPGAVNPMLLIGGGAGTSLYSATGLSEIQKGRVVSVLKGTHCLAATSAASSFPLRLTKDVWNTLASFSPRSGCQPFTRAGSTP